MEERRLQAARRALEEVREGLSSGGPWRTAAALERLFELTADAREPELVVLYGHGLFSTGLAAMLSNDDPVAISYFGGACDVCLSLQSKPEGMELAIAISYLFEAVDGVRTTRRQNQSGPEPRGIFLALLGHVLQQAGAHEVSRGAGADVAQEMSSLLERARAAEGVTSEEIRFLLAAFFFAAGEEATNRQRSGEAQEFYVQAARFLERIRVPGERLMALAEFVYPSLAFERQRHGERDRMHASLDRYDHFLRKQGVDTAWREQHIATQRSFFDLQLAVWLGSMADARRYAQELRRIATPDFVARHGGHLDAVISGGGAKAMHDALPPGLSSVGPGHGMSALHEINAADELTNEHVLKLIRASISGDPQAAWRAAAWLGKGLDTTGNPLTAIMFGKLSTRVLQRMRMELAQRGSQQLDSFRDDIATSATQLLGKQLVGAGRLGEALCVANLIDAERPNLPVPRVSDIDAITDAACSLSEPERQAIDYLDRTASAATGAQGDMRAAIERVEADLRRGMTTTSHVDDGDAVLENGVAYLAIIEAGDRVRATVRGTFGVQSETLAVRAADLNTIAFDALRALSSRRILDAMGPCRALHDLVVAPFRPLLDRQGVRVLIVRSSGALRRIPLSVLHDGSAYLAERYAIVAHPGVAPLRRRGHLTSPVRVSSVIVPEAPGMDPLPAARLDADLLRRLLAGNGLGSVEIADGIGVDAGKLEAVLATRPTVWHMSSHFEADRADASRSAFILANGSRYPLARLAQQDLSGVELAVMMGCETQSVSEAGGEMGITAIDALLLRMGVGAVIGTAWSVDDVMAHSFLKTFLESLFNARCDLAESVRRSLVAIGRDPVSGRWRPPHEWGAFVLSGAWSGLA